MKPITRVVFLAFIATVAAVCRGTDTPTAPPEFVMIAPPEIRTPYALVDGATTGNEHFFFEPPIAQSEPPPNGTFDQSAPVVVEVCEPINDDCPFLGEPLERFTTEGKGPERIRADATEEHFIVNWETGKSGLTDGTTYRIRILLGGLELGHADIVLKEEGAGAAGSLEFKKGSTIPIRFRVEEEAAQLTTISLSAELSDGAQDQLTFLLSSIAAVPIADEMTIALAGEDATLVFALNKAEEPVLATFAAPGAPTLVDAGSTATAIVRLLLLPLASTMEASDLEEPIGIHPSFSSLIGKITELSEDGQSFLESPTARDLAADILADVLAGAVEPIDNGTASGEGSDLYALQLGGRTNGLPLEVSDGPGTSFHLCSTTRVYLSARSWEQLSIIDEVLVPPSTFVGNLLPCPLRDQSAQLGGRDGAILIDVRQSTVSAIENAKVVFSDFLTLTADISGLTFPKAGTLIELEQLFVEEVVPLIAQGRLDVLALLTTFSALTDNIVAIWAADLLEAGAARSAFKATLRKALFWLSAGNVGYLAISQLSFYRDLARFASIGDPIGSILLCQRNGQLFDCDEVVSIVLEPEDVTLMVGEQLIMTASLLNAAELPVEARELDIFLDNEDIADVVPLGETEPGVHELRIIGKEALGGTVLLVHVDGVQAQGTVSVIPISVNMTVDPASVEMYMGEIRLVQALVRTADGEPISGLSITCDDCTEANLAIRQIAELAPGEYELRVQVQRISDPLPAHTVTLSAALDAGPVLEAPLTVIVHRLTGIELVPKVASIRLGEITTIAVIGQPEGIEVTGETWSWNAQGLLALNGRREGGGWPQQTRPPAGSPLEVLGIRAGLAEVTVTGGLAGELFEAQTDLAVWADHLAISGTYEGDCTFGSHSGATGGPATGTFTFSHAEVSSPRVTGEITIQISGLEPFTEQIDAIVGVSFSELSGFSAGFGHEIGLPSGFVADTPEGPYLLTYRPSSNGRCELTQMQ